jgi:hypothetical protein
LEGKTVPAAFERATAASPWPRVSAGCSANGGLGVGQSKTDPQSNEIPAIPALLPLVASKGCRVTMEAMGCQTAIAEQLRHPGGADL